MSVSENGFITIWRIGANDVTILKDVFGMKVEVTCISSCPHLAWKVAFGSKNGTVLVTDLRSKLTTYTFNLRNVIVFYSILTTILFINVINSVILSETGRVLFKLRVHDKMVTALAWCPTPYNIFEKDFIISNENCKYPSDKETDKMSICSSVESENKTTAENTSDLINTNIGPDTDEKSTFKDSKNSVNTTTEVTNSENATSSIVNNEIQIKHSYANKNKPNPWVNLKHADDDEIEELGLKLNDDLSITLVTPVDFLAECKQVKQQIIGEQKQVDNFIQSGSENSTVINNGGYQPVMLLASIGVGG